MWVGNCPGPRPSWIAGNSVCSHLHLWLSAQAEFFHGCSRRMWSTFHWRSRYEVIAHSWLAGTLKKHFLWGRICMNFYALWSLCARGTLRYLETGGSKISTDTRHSLSFVWFCTVSSLELQQAVVEFTCLACLVHKERRLMFNIEEEVSTSKLESIEAFRDWKLLSAFGLSDVWGNLWDESRYHPPAVSSMICMCQLPVEAEEMDPVKALISSWFHPW